MSTILPRVVSGGVFHNLQGDNAFRHLGQARISARVRVIVSHEVSYNSLKLKGTQLIYVREN